MRIGRLVHVLGDVHGDFDLLDIMIDLNIRKSRRLHDLAERWRRRGDDFGIVMLQAGDFGDPARPVRNHVPWLGRIPIHWCAGNHDRKADLEAGDGRAVETADGVFFQPFGSTLEIIPGLSVLFAGGSESWDRGRIGDRKNGVSPREMARLRSVGKIDWVVSHTAPAGFGLEREMRKADPSWRIDVLPSMRKLEGVRRMLAPKRWFFGHFHRHASGTEGGCAWECLSRFGLEGKFRTEIWLETEA